MKLGSLITSALASAALWMLADIALAEMNCKFERPAVDEQVTLKVSAITVGRDVPVGSEVYRQRYQINPSKAARVVCTYTKLSSVIRSFTVGATAQKAPWSEGRYAGKVYKTSIAGLGVAIDSQHGIFPVVEDFPSTLCMEDTRCHYEFDGGFWDGASTFDLVLIKIDKVVQPGILSGRGLPTLMASIKFDTVEMRGSRITMDGAIRIVSKTCKTPNVNVPMGTYLTSAFTGEGYATGGTNFSIFLNDCPESHGTYSSHPPVWISNGDSTGSLDDPGTADKNSLAYRIDPVGTVIKPGVLSLDPSVVGGAPSASGVGVQITTAAGDNVPLREKTVRGLTDRGGGSYSIDLRARYLQTKPRVTPGPANASATFTIIYE